MTLWALMIAACGGDPAPPPAVGVTADTGPPDLRTFVDLDPEGPFAFHGPADHTYFGEGLAVGCDLDRDGVLEWAASAPDHTREASVSPVLLFEDDELLATFEPERRKADWFGGWSHLSLAVGDTDGDGYGELLVPESFNLYGTYIRVVRGLDPAEDILLMIRPEEQWTPHYVTVQRVDGVDQPVLLSSIAAHRWRFDRFDLRGVEPGTTLFGGEHTQIAWEEPIDLFEPGEPVIADLDGDGSHELVYGTYRSSYQAGTTWVCPAELGIDIPGSCDVLAPGLSTGRFHEVGDLDGDGDLDIVAVASSTAGDDGEVWCLTAEGEVIAHIRGTRGNMFGSHPTYVVDDDGEAWLILAEFNFYSATPTQAYRFRVADLRGELTEADATTVWQTPSTGIGRQSAVYRATPDAPLQLLLTEPTNGSGVVYKVPWDGE
jgi:hypothetical protein